MVSVSNHHQPAWKHFSGPMQYFRLTLARQLMVALCYACISSSGASALQNTPRPAVMVTSEGARCSRKIGKEFVEVPDPFDFGVVETLIVVAVWHHHYGLSIFRHVPAVFVPIIHEQTYP